MIKSGIRTVTESTGSFVICIPKVYFENFLGRKTDKMDVFIDDSMNLPKSVLMSCRLKQSPRVPKRASRRTWRLRCIDDEGKPSDSAGTKSDNVIVDSYSGDLWRSRQYRHRRDANQLMLDAWRRGSGVSRHACPLCTGLGYDPAVPTEPCIYCKGDGLLFVVPWRARGMGYTE